MNKNDFQTYVDLLSSGDIKNITWALHHLSIDRGADINLLAYVERFLEDQTYTYISQIPPVFIEIRALAANALAALRVKLNISEPVVIVAARAIFQDELFELLDQAEIQTEPGLLGKLEGYRILIEKGIIPVKKYTVNSDYFRAQFKSNF